MAPARRPRGVLTVMVLALLGTLPGMRPAAADTVRGYVLDAATQTRLADVEVAFLVGGESGFSEMVRRRTDADGNFAFNGPFLKAGTPFALSASYRDMDYRTGPLQVGEQDQVIIEVYDATQADDRIVIDGDHLFLAVTDAGLDVARLIQVENLGEATYVGPGEGDGDRHVLQFTIPEGSVALQGHGDDVHRGSATQVFTTSPVPPGESQITFTYQLEGDSFGGEYVHETGYPTRRLELFLQPASLQLSGPEFEDLGPLSLHDASYHHYRVSDLAPGRRVTIALPFSKPLRWVLKWLLVGLVPLATLAAFGLTRPMSRHEAPEAGGADDGDELGRRRLRLLAELARLDDELAAASGPAAEDLRQRRALLKAEVVEVYRLLAAAT